MSEGLSADDPGIALLGRALADVDPATLLLVHCGDLPGLRGPATRLVLDIREQEGARSRTIRADDGAAIAALPPMGNTACWPRAHLGKDFSFACLAQGAQLLARGGALWCSVRKSKGAESLGDFMVTLLGNVDTVARGRGYRLLRSIREESFDADAAAAAIALRYEITDPALPGVVLHSAPGVFSRRALDDGTRALIEHVEAWAADAPATPRQVIDLCAGIGPLGIWAGRRFDGARVLAVESNVLAAAMARHNGDTAGLGSRLHVALHDGLPAPVAVAGVVPGEVDLALVNPPTHANAEDLAALLGGLRKWLAPGASTFVVVSRAGTAVRALRAAGADVDEHAVPGYAILHARWPT